MDLIYLMLCWSMILPGAFQQNSPANIRILKPEAVPTQVEGELTASTNPSLIMIAQKYTKQTLLGTCLSAHVQSIGMISSHVIFLFPRYTRLDSTAFFSTIAHIPAKMYHSCVNSFRFQRKMAWNRSFGHNRRMKRPQWQSLALGLNFF